MVSDAHANRLRERVNDLETENKRITDENIQMRRLIGAYVVEHRLCRFCKNLHFHCSPTDSSCAPEWRGL